MSITDVPCADGDDDRKQDDDMVVSPLPNKHNKHASRRLRRELGSTSSSSKKSSGSSKKNSNMLSFLPVVDIVAGMGCGGVNVEYILRDTQGVDETSLAQILASNQLAHAVQVHPSYTTHTLHTTLSLPSHALTDAVDPSSLLIPSNTPPHSTFQCSPRCKTRATRPKSPLRRR